MFDRYPAIKLCVPFIVGILIGWQLNISLWWFIAGLSILALLSILFLKFKPQESVTSLFILFSLMLFGMFKISFDAKYQPNNSIERFLTEEEQEATLVGVVNERAVSKGEYYSLRIETETLMVSGYGLQVTGFKLKQQVDGDAIVSIPKKNISKDVIENLSYGRKVNLTGMFKRPPRARNPGEFDYRNYLKLQGIYAQVYVRTDSNIQLGEKTGTWILSEVIHPFRDWISTTMDSLIGGEEAKLVKGLVIGERSEIDPSIKLAFTNAGLMHILAVSGLNVGLVAIMFWSVFSLFRFPRSLIGVLTVLSLVFFIFLTGAEASVTRAVIMACVFIGAKIFEQRTSLLNALGVAALVILLIDSRWLFDVGFQLSFVAVLSLAYILPKLERQVNTLPERFRANSFFRKYILLATAVTLSATIGTLPLTAYYFHKISIVGIAMNLLAVPVSGIILALGCAVVLMAAISTWLGSMYATVAYAFSWFLLRFTEWGGNLPFSVVEINLSFPQAVGMFAVILFLLEFHRPLVRRLGIISFLLIANVVLYSSLFAESNSSLKITMLDVGQGDAIVVQLPNGKTMLVDAGPIDSKRDAGTKTIAPFLKRIGVEKIDALFISHPHADHLGGTPALLRAIEVGTIYECGAKSESKLVKEIGRLTDSLQIESKKLLAGNIVTVDSSVRLYILHPFDDKNSFEENLNNHSLVIKLVYGTTSILFSGDAEEPAEQEITAAFDNFLDCDVIKVGHHGSITSSSEELLEKVTPQIALVSVGNKNKFKHPSPTVIQRFQDGGCKVFRTDKMGAIVLESDGQSWKEIQWRED
ncbi:MAG: DNA internalization-related competence protein ComEC/Rec2 [Ignavibacteriae bacterium]|nr:DNA internalization-related competence protein ComEC/Rec2 [Ignavibacteriota bacterium]